MIVVDCGKCKHYGNSRLVCSATSPSPPPAVIACHRGEGETVGGGAERERIVLCRHNPPPLPGPTIVVASSERRVETRYSGEAINSRPVFFCFPHLPPSEFRAPPSKTRCLCCNYPCYSVTERATYTYTCHSYSTSRRSFVFYPVGTKRTQCLLLCIYIQFQQHD